MNILAAMAEMALWDQEKQDRCVVDTTIEEFPERMGELANLMHEIYSKAFKDLMLTM
jgi:hypothetical protein